MSVKFRYLYAFLIALFVFTMPAFLFNGCGGPALVSAAEVGSPNELPAPTGIDPRGLSRPVEQRMFEYLERYERDALNAIIFKNREYMVLNQYSAGVQSIYYFVLFKEGVEISPSAADAPGKPYYFIEFGRPVNSLDTVIESMFVFKSDGSYLKNHYMDGTRPFANGNVFVANNGALRINASTFTVSHASFSTDKWEGSFVNYHWLPIKDYSVRVGRLTDYERIFVALIFVITCAVVRLYRFRS